MALNRSGNRGRLLMAVGAGLVTLVIVACTGSQGEAASASSSTTLDDLGGGAVSSSTIVDVGSGEWPVVVEVGSTDPFTGDLVRVCLGTVLSGSRVVTAAHCSTTPEGESRPLFVSSGAEWVEAGVVGLGSVALRSAVPGVGDVMVLSAAGMEGASGVLELGVSAEAGQRLTVLRSNLVVSVVVDHESCDDARLICVRGEEAGGSVVCPGDSGAPLFDEERRLIAVAVRGDCEDGAAVFATFLEEDVDLLTSSK